MGRVENVSNIDYSIVQYDVANSLTIKPFLGCKIENVEHIIGITVRFNQRPIEIWIWCSNIVIESSCFTLTNECNTNDTENEKTNEECDTLHPSTNPEMKYSCSMCPSVVIYQCLFSNILIRSICLFALLLLF